MFCTAYPLPFCTAYPPPLTTHPSRYAATLRRCRASRNSSVCIDFRMDMLSYTLASIIQKNEFPTIVWVLGAS